MTADAVFWMRAGALNVWRSVSRPLSARATTRNPAYALIWVHQKDEHDSDSLRADARCPRLEPAGRDLGPAIPAADEAIRVGSVEPVLRLLTGVLDERLRDQFGEAIAAKTFNSDDLSAGRAYVTAYVEFIHFVERVYESTMKAPQGHFNEAPVSFKDR